MVREDLIEGAISFLQDPSVSSAPLEQRISFLRSKNLTQEEIDASLARVGQSTATQAASPPAQPYQPSQQYRQGQPQQYGAYQQQQYWAQQMPPPPPEPPRRDWRDWFIVATVVGGLGYGAYWTAKRYIQPLIAPPTPPQLEQDKASIDASFDKAFALLDQLATDTQELKDSEKARTERLDGALGEVEAVLGRLKEAQEEREREAKRVARELGDVRDLIPRAIEKERQGTDERLKELSGEMKSLKTLLASRVGGGSGVPPVPGSQRSSTTPSWQLPSASPQQHQQPQPPNGTPAPSVPGITDHGTSNSASGTIAAPSTNGIANGTPAATSLAVAPDSTSSTGPDRSSSNSPFGSRFLQQGKSAIPAWQLAAAKKREEANGGSAAATDSGTVSEEVSA